MVFFILFLVLGHLECQGGKDELTRKAKETTKKLNIMNEGQREKQLILEKGLAHTVPTT